MKMLRKGWDRHRIIVICGFLLSYVAIPPHPCIGASSLLYEFGRSGALGSNPRSALTLTADGTLYGSTFSGGGAERGTVFSLTPGTNGAYMHAIVLDFAATNGAGPNSKLVLGADGTLYGTTLNGGRYLFGTVFSLRPDAVGGYTHRVLWEFGHSPTNGLFASGLVLSPGGAIYGVTGAGGKWDVGTTFSLIPDGSGGHTHAALLNFSGTNGATPPPDGLVLSEDGTLYAIAYAGGINDEGTVLALRADSAGSFTNSVLLNFEAATGGRPCAGLTAAGNGTFYGTTYGGGAFDSGTVFALIPRGTDGFRHEVLFSFAGTNGANPWAGLALGADGKLYGTTYRGGRFDKGTVFSLQPGELGSYTHTVPLHFDGTNGAAPVAAPIIDKDGSIFGTTSSGGAFGGGVIYRITPESPQAPLLSIELSQAAVELVWPSAANDFVLEQSHSFSAASFWTLVPPPYDAKPSQNTKIVPLTTNTFFRLRRP